MKQILTALLLLLAGSARADLIFDWVGECHPGSCIAAYGTFVLDSSYVPGTPVQEYLLDSFGNPIWPISPRMKSYSLTFERLIHANLDRTDPTREPVLGPPDHIIETFSWDAATSTQADPPLLEGVLPVSGPSDVILWNPVFLESLWATRTRDGSSGSWYGYSRFPDTWDWVQLDFIWHPAGPSSTFTLRPAQVSEPATLALTALALLALMRMRHR